MRHYFLLCLPRNLKDVYFWMSISLGQTALSIVLVSFVLFSPSDNYIKLIDAVHLTIVSVFYIANIIIFPVLYAFVINTQITQQSVFLKDIILESTIKRSNLIQEISDADKSNSMITDKRTKGDRVEQLDSSTRHIGDIVRLMEATDSLHLLKLFVFPINVLILRFLVGFGLTFSSLVSLNLSPVLSQGYEWGFIDLKNLRKHFS